MNNPNYLRYEELFLNSMPVTYRNFLDRYILNFGGTDFFTNSVHCIYALQSDNYKSEIDGIIYALEGRYNPVFRIIGDKGYSNIDRYLMVKNFGRICPMCVVLADIRDKREILFPYASFNEQGIFVDKNITSDNSDWIDDYSYLNNMSDDLRDRFVDMITMLENDNYAFTLILEGNLIGQGFCTRHGDILVVQNIVVNPKYQSLGYGDRILKSILTYAIRQGCSYAIGEVPLEDEISKRLFAKNFFDLQYQAYYRAL